MIHERIAMVLYGLMNVYYTMINMHNYYHMWLYILWVPKMEFAQT